MWARTSRSARGPSWCVMDVMACTLLFSSSVVAPRHPHTSTPTPHTARPHQSARCILKDCCHIEPGTVLAPDTVIPPYALVRGVPGQYIACVRACPSLLIHSVGYPKAKAPIPDSHPVDRSLNQSPYENTSADRRRAPTQHAAHHARTGRGGLPGSQAAGDCGSGSSGGGSRSGSGRGEQGRGRGKSHAGAGAAGGGADRGGVIALSEERKHG